MIVNLQKKQNEGEKKWHLPPCAPKLLPILANNYSLEADGHTVALSDSQFLYTIQKYVEDECPYIEGSKVEPPADWEGRKVQFEMNLERKVLPFTPTAGVAIPAGRSRQHLDRSSAAAQARFMLSLRTCAGEEMGRPMMDMDREKFLCFYGPDIANAAASAASLDRGSKRRKGTRPSPPNLSVYNYSHCQPGRVGREAPTQRR